MPLACTHNKPYSLARNSGYPNKITFRKIALADLRYCLRVGKLSLEAVSTKIDTTRPTQKLDGCLKYRNGLNLPVFLCCIVILKTDYAAFSFSIKALF